MQRCRPASQLATTTTEPEPEMPVLLAEAGSGNQVMNFMMTIMKPKVSSGVMQKRNARLS